MAVPLCAKIKQLTQDTKDAYKVVKFMSVQLVNRNLKQPKVFEDTLKSDTILKKVNFKCGIFGRHFTREELMKDHEKKHEKVLDEEKEFYCPLCQLNFAKSTRFHHCCTTCHFKDPVLSAKYDAKFTVSAQIDIERFLKLEGFKNLTDPVCINDFAFLMSMKPPNFSGYVDVELHEAFGYDLKHYIGLINQSKESTLEQWCLTLNLNINF